MSSGWFSSSDFSRFGAICHFRLILNYMCSREIEFLLKFPSVVITSYDVIDSHFDGE
jgi:hypothetical protein